MYKVRWSPRRSFRGFKDLAERDTGNKLHDILSIFVFATPVSTFNTKRSSSLAAEDHPQFGVAAARRGSKLRKDRNIRAKAKASRRVSPGCRLADVSLPSLGHVLRSPRGAESTGHRPGTSGLKSGFTISAVLFFFKCLCELRRYCSSPPAVSRSKLPVALYKLRNFFGRQGNKKVCYWKPQVNPSFVRKTSSMFSCSSRNTSKENRASVKRRICRSLILTRSLYPKCIRVSRGVRHAPRSSYFTAHRRPCAGRRDVDGR